jgi:hypothetical protein
MMTHRVNYECRSTFPQEDYSQEYKQPMEDEEGEGFVAGRVGRSSNYTMEDVILLCNTWKVVSTHAAVSTKQVKDTQ